MKIGQIIRERRKEAGLNQKELAKACRLSQNHISDLELDKKFPKENTLKRICVALDIPLPLLLFMSVDEEDIAKEKREAFRLLFPLMKTMIWELFPEQSKQMNSDSQ